MVFGGRSAGRWSANSWSAATSSTASPGSAAPGAAPAVCVHDPQAAADLLPVRAAAPGRAVPRGGPHRDDRLPGGERPTGRRARDGRGEQDPRATEPAATAGGRGNRSWRPAAERPRSPQRLGSAHQAGLRSGSALLSSVRGRTQNHCLIERRQTEVIEKILRHCGRWEESPARGPPARAGPVAD
jgi:hypothetical protein